MWDEDGGLSYAQAALAAYDLPDNAELKLISLSENATFLVSRDRPLGVLRIYRPDYQTEAAKRSELAWIAELRSQGTVATPQVIPTKSGQELHRVKLDNVERDAVLFEFVPGRELGEEEMSTYASVGEISAKLHLQVLAWDKPAGFERMSWELERILGPDAPWGDWRQGPGLDGPALDVLELAEEVVRHRLESYSPTVTNSGLVHGDLRAANVLVGEDENLWVIDFDDSGFGWFLWDLCSTTTFIEHTPQVDDVVDAWLDGYTKIRLLNEDDLAAIVDLVFLRRLHVLAWLGTHPESDLARDLGRTYAHGSVEVATKYLNGNLLPRLRTTG